MESFLSNTFCHAYTCTYNVDSWRFLGAQFSFILWDPSHKSQFLFIVRFLNWPYTRKIGPNNFNDIKVPVYLINVTFIKSIRTILMYDKSLFYFFFFIYPSASNNVLNKYPWLWQRISNTLPSPLYNILYKILWFNW